VDKSHEYITYVFGEDWKEKYVVWDPAWGTGNLTRDYKFKELYCSTLNQSDIDTANQMGYNPEAIKFQFDFLNDPDEKLPQELRNAINQGREIIVLMNPPYAAGTADKNGSRSNMSNTKIKEKMVKDKYGKSVQNIYAHFIYRISELKIYSICFFSPMNFMQTESFQNFRDKFYTKYNFEKGFLMNSSNFADVSSWALTFTIWEKNEK
jgi:hypothetical protein